MDLVILCTIGFFSNRSLRFLGVSEEETSGEH